MKILLVEDKADDAASCRAALSCLGHQMIQGGSRAEALDLLERDSPDVVVADTAVPGLDCVDFARVLQRQAPFWWRPLVFFGKDRDDELERQALAAGADAYFAGPSAAGALVARLQTIQRLLALLGQAQGREAELARYRAMESDQRAIAQHLVDRLVDHQALGDPAMHFWKLPVRTLHGDLLLAARTPSGVLHLLLANGTGQGLLASLNALPLATPFYRMTEKGFGIDAIARELNRKLRVFLSADSSVAATLVSVDAREQMVQVWNGGNPAPFLLNVDGRVARLFTLYQQPLGMADDDGFQSELEANGLDPGLQLILYSDGLSAACDQVGAVLGKQGLVERVAAFPAERRFDQLVANLESHLAGQTVPDDITLVVVDCLDRDGCPSSVPAVVAERADIGGNWRFDLRLTGRELPQVDVVPLLLDLSGQMGVAAAHSGRLFVVLAEMFNNALDHGLLRMDSGIKLREGGMDAWMEERGQRLARLDDSQFIEIGIEQVWQNQRAWLRIVCTDSGSGFAHGDLPAEAGDEQPFGRGITLLRAIATNVQFNSAGNSVQVLLEVDKIEAG